MHVEGGNGTRGELLEVAVHLLLGLDTERLDQHLVKHDELVRIVGQPELTGRRWQWGIAGCKECVRERER